jgi:hypothetical protein
MQNSLYKFLRQQDQKRLNIRALYKTKMHDVQQKPVRGLCITVPKIHLKNSDEFLRNGLSWHFNGFIVSTGSNVIAVDPGVGFLYRLQISNINPSTINYVYISHAHIDHYGGANELLDWLIRAKRPVTIMGAKTVFAEKAISDFHSARTKFPKDWAPLHSSVELSHQKEIQLADAKIVPFSLHHGVECMGFRLITKYGVVAYLSDTGYAVNFKERGKVISLSKTEYPTTDGFTYVSWHRDIIKNIAKSNLLLANVDSFYPNKNSSTHLSIMDLVHILKQPETQVDKIILGHINPVAELEYHEWGAKLAEYVHGCTGINCQCPSSTGLVVSL